MIDRVLDAAQAMFINQITGGSDDKKVPDVLVEHDFRRCARIGAPEDDGERMLRLRGLRAARGGWFARRNFAVHKTRISFLELGERGIRAHGSDWMICGKNKRDDTNQTDERDECEFGGGLHIIRLRVCRCEDSEREQDLALPGQLKKSTC